MLRLMGWSLVAAALVAAAVALGTVPILLLQDASGWREAALVAHGLAAPVVAPGLAGLALVALADGPVWTPGVAVIVAGIGVAVLGAVGIAPWWQGPVLGPDQPVLSVAIAVAVVGSGAAWLGAAAIVLLQRRWPPPLAGAVLAAGVHSVLGTGVALVWLATVVAAGDHVALHPGAVPGSPPMMGWLLAAGVLAHLARTDGAPAALDAGFAGLLGAVGLGSVAAPVGGGAVAGTLAVGVAGALAYTIDAARRGALQLRAGQPLGLVLAGVWGLGVVGVALLSSQEIDVSLHDTYAELAPGHLLGPLLATIALAAGLADRAGGWRSWIAAAGSGLLLCAGAWLATAGFVALGVAGMPRRYHVWVETDDGGWVALGFGGTLFTLGIAAAVAVAVAARSGGRGAPGR